MLNVFLAFHHIYLFILLIFLQFCNFMSNCTTCNSHIDMFFTLLLFGRCICSGQWPWNKACGVPKVKVAQTVRLIFQHCGEFYSWSDGTVL